jgi:hypothetical protein
MSHLSRKHLLAFIDDPHTSGLSPERKRHIEACAACQAAAADLRSIIGEVRNEPGGEPSPLFWDHLAARVADAIRDQVPEPAPSLRTWRFGGQTAAWTAVAATVILGSTMVAWRATLHAPAAPDITLGTAADARIDDVEDDQAWKVVRAAADGLPWEDVQAAGIAARPGAAEGVVMELTAEERAELAKLLESEMKRSGV